MPGPVFDHHFLCMQAAMNDLGIALAPWCLLQDDIAADRLRPLFAQPQLPNAGIHALYRPDGPAAAPRNDSSTGCAGRGPSRPVAHSASKKSSCPNPSSQPRTPPIPV